MKAYRMKVECSAPEQPFRFIVPTKTLRRDDTFNIQEFDRYFNNRDYFTRFTPDRVEFYDEPVALGEHRQYFDPLVIKIV